MSGPAFGAPCAVGAPPVNDKKIMKFPWIFSEFLKKPKVAIDIFSNFEKFKCILGI